MIKLIIIARCIPEDVYLRSIDQPASVLTGEKKFSVVVRDPEQWYIGRLANEIKTRYESLYQRPFGQIKYLKDAEDDCDLDLELSVADLLVDEGKAANDGADQKRTVKVIQEGGRAIRAGSVIPDLSRTHYQPRTRPPVPKFPVAEKRPATNEHNEEQASKRRRLDQIEEEHGEDIVQSVEHGNENAINGPTIDEAAIEPKIESPEIPHTWINTGPATRDELEELPEPPQNWQRHDKQNSTAHKTPGNRKERDTITDLFAKHNSLNNAQAPITPPYTGNGMRTPGAQAVQALNGMKSASPAARQSATSSSNKFKKARKDVYDHPESDIDDSQMSPQSRAARTKITPRLVRTPAARTSTSLGTTKSRSDSGRKLVADDDEMELDNHKENPSTKPRPAPDQARPRSSHTDRSSELASDEVWSIQGDGTRIKRKKSSRLSRSERRSSGTSSGTASRSSSAASSVRAPDTNMQKRKGPKKVAPTKVADVGNYDEDRDGGIDSPSAQLEEALRRSSPVQRKNRHPLESPPEESEEPDIQRPPESDSELEEPKPAPKTSKSLATTKKDKGKQPADDLKCYSCWRDKTSCDNARPKCGRCVTRNQLCQIYSMTKAAAEQEKGERATERKPGKSTGPPPDQLRCYTCWYKKNRCDNARPKCNSCAKISKNCQIYSMTKEAAEKEKADRQAGLAPAKKATPQPSSKSFKRKAYQPRLSEGTVATSDAEQESPAEDGSQHESIAENEEDEDEAEEPALPEKTSKKAIAAKHKLSKDAKSKKRKDTTESSSASVSDDNTTPDVSIKIPELSKTATQARASGNNSSSNVTVRIPDLSKTEAQAQAYLRPQESKMSRERSVDSRATSNSLVIPAGMTAEDYYAMVQSRSTLTEEKRREQNLLARKLRLQKEKEPTPLVRRSQSSQDLTERPKKAAGSVKSDEKVPSSSKHSHVSSTQPAKASKPANVPSTPAPAPAQVPKSAPPKAGAAQNTSSKFVPGNREQTHSKLATTASATNSDKHQNPPFRQPQRKSLPASNTSATATPSDTEPRSLKALAQKLKQKSGGSSASTPQPQSAAAKVAASIPRSSQQRKGFSLSDDDDDEEEEDSEDNDDEEDPYAKAIAQAKANAKKDWSSSGSDDSDSD